jgi:hypothetical protein
MKIIITEEQYNLIIEERNLSLLPFIRRANKETLDHYINLGIMNHPTLCDDFDNPYDYVDEVIDYAVDTMLYDIDDDIDDKDYFSDALDFLRGLCRRLYEDKLIEDYNFTCIENQ